MFCSLRSTESIDLEMNSSTGGQRGMDTFKSWVWVPGASLLPNDGHTASSITVPQPGHPPGQGFNHLSHS